MLNEYSGWSTKYAMNADERPVAAIPEMRLPYQALTRTEGTKKVVKTVFSGNDGIMRVITRLANAQTSTDSATNDADKAIRRKLDFGSKSRPFNRSFVSIKTLRDAA
jgi:hypothetical protein